VVQGTALGPLVRLLGVSKDAQRDKKHLEEQQLFGNEQAARAALDRLVALQNEGSVSPEVAQRLGQIYKDRLAEAQAQADSESAGQEGDSEIRTQLLRAERARILQLREEGKISDHALGFLERKLDLSETLLD
jgi:monovalent cation/hydrogen antiporter